MPKPTQLDVSQSEGGVGTGGIGPADNHAPLPLERGLQGILFFGRRRTFEVACADPAISDVWVEDVSIASILILLAAESIGLGGCWIQIRKRKHSDTKGAEDYVREVLGIPDRLRVAAILSIGYPAVSKPPRPREELLFERVHRDGYGIG